MDAGFLVETLETSAPWSQLPTVHAAVRRRPARQPSAGCVVMCHVSHLYPHGASLYFTVLGARRRPTRPRSGSGPSGRPPTRSSPPGATITHHHAVGTDHRPWMTDEIGALGVEVLQAVKEVLDPVGVLNPGKLIP